jgi:GrpB-like predicted nucleotidyltransferase (UPF0157 family)
MPAPEPVELSDPSPLWPAIFALERDALATLFPDAEVRIEHIGSTAVPGLVAKPIIDVMLGAPSLAAIEAAIPALEAMGYEYVPEFERAIPERRYFRKQGLPPGSFHLHAVAFGGPFWRRHLAFRDALLADPALAARYGALKRKLASRHRNDRVAYTDGKGEFIREVLENL